MRRPVKPFVTEYKGPNRRPTHPAGSSPRLSPEDYSFLQAPNDAFARHGGDNLARSSEDSYEAALRAADALFSPAASREPGPSPDIQAAEAGDGQAESAEADAIRVDASRSGGRILRVIDEPAATDLSDMEAERAPKRRGRKPGSKNRPKAYDAPFDAPLAGSVATAHAARFVLPDGNGRSGASDWSGYAVDPDLAVAGASAKGQTSTVRHPQAVVGKSPPLTGMAPDRGLQLADRRDTVESDGADDERLDDEVLDPDVAGAGLTGQPWADDAPARPRPVFEGRKSVGVAQRPADPGNLESRNGERFTWVRTKLAPGERWKRRLPKVCW